MIQFFSIPGFPNHQISSCSEFVKALDRWKVNKFGTKTFLPERFLSINLNQDGYPTVYIHGLGKVGIHQLMAWTFNGPQPEGTQVLHRDDNKLNNLPGNLYYGTHVENMSDRTRNGHTAKGEATNNSKLISSQVATIYRRLLAGESMIVLATEFGVSHKGIQVIKYKKCWLAITNAIDQELALA